METSLTLIYIKKKIEWFTIIIPITMSQIL